MDKMIVATRDDIAMKIFLPSVWICFLFILLMISLTSHAEEVWGWYNDYANSPFQTATCRETEAQACEEERFPYPEKGGDGNFYFKWRYKDNGFWGCAIEHPNFTFHHPGAGIGRCLLSSSPVNLGNSPNNTCNPINITTGNKFFKENDYTGQGVNPLQLTRYYNSKERNIIWKFSYRQSLFVSNVSIQAFREDGSVIRFPISNGNIVASSQRPERLSVVDSTYRLELPGNIIEEYDSNGRLMAIKFANGQQHRLTYSNSSIQIAHDKNTLVYTLTDSPNRGLVTRAELPDGSIINYSYDKYWVFDRLLTVAYPGSVVKIYLYEDTSNFDAYGFITGIIDENNNRISSVQYDNQGRATSSEKGPLGSGIERAQIAYNSDGTSTLTNALGKKSTYHFTQFNGEYKITQVEGEPSANCAGANQAYTYDANGFMASKTDWKGNVTTYMHNNRGQELSRTEASGTAHARTITTEWHSEFNLPTKIIEPERTTVMTYDTEGRLLSTTYEATP
jgi:YD repeat-containing protein